VFPPVRVSLMRNHALYLTAAALLLGACGDSTEPRVPTALELEFGTLDVEVTDSILLTVLVLDQFGAAYATLPPGLDVTWAVQDPAVARVEDGRVVGLQSGSTVVTATAAGLAPAQAAVQVTPNEFTGQLAFEYAGHASGSLDVTTGFSLDPLQGPTTGAWVVAFHDPDFNSHDVLVHTTRPDGSIDLAWFWVTAEVTEPGIREADSGLLVLGFVPELNAAEGTYELIAGIVDFTEVSDARLAGVFTLTFADAAGNIVEVTNGAFDAPQVPASAVLDNDAPAAVDGGMAGDAAGAALLPRRDSALRSLLPGRIR
jgi:hypothetical protein